MGGKGQRRREKNFNAAHGGYSRLPLPPKSNEVDVLPSKLRRLLEFTNSSSLNNNKAKRKNNNPTGAGGDKKLNELGKGEKERNTRDETNDKKKKAKRKRKEISDLRFDEGKGVVGVKRRERQKKYLEVKRNKNKKPKIEDGITFQGHEEIKFGEVVQAPPKLLVVPKKVTKPAHDASRERLRVQTVEAYRNYKAWSSRPGIGVPSVVNPAPSF